MKAELRGTRFENDDDGCTEVLMEINRWAHERMTWINRDILDRKTPPDVLVRELNQGPLRIAPIPESTSPINARRLLTLFGMFGSSVGRHYQEADPAMKATPTQPLELLFVTKQRIPFREYVRRVALRTGTGHQPKDSFSSLVRWNVPTMRVMWEGTELSSIRGYFSDATRTYTGGGGEATLFTLLKKAEAFELAANNIFLSLVRREIAIDSPEALERVRLAKLLLDGVRSVNIAYFAKDDDGKQALTAEHFMDAFRQFAVHWEVGDLPASGSQDAEFMRRDLYIGIKFPTYERHVRRMFPALLEHERTLLNEAMQCPNISTLIMERLPLTLEECAQLGPDALLTLVAEYPYLMHYYLLLRANARIGSSHLRLAKEFLFNPMRERERQNISDAIVVSNWAGTTGMLEQLLDTLTEGRRQHVLRFFTAVPLERLLMAAGIEEPQIPDDELFSRVGFTPH